jgi:hypothetical protein
MNSTTLAKIESDSTMRQNIRHPLVLLGGWGMGGTEGKPGTGAFG